MNISTYLIVFGSGLIAGILIMYFVLKIDSGDSINISGIFGRIFSLMGRVVRFSQKQNTGSDEGGGTAPLHAVDDREQGLYDSAQTIRAIMLIMAANIQRTDKAASDSTLVLDDVKNAINTMGLPTDLSEEHSLLMKEIDRVISSNAALKGQLAKSQKELTAQQRQIEDLRTAVRIDGLTQLANRSYFDEKLSEMFVLWKRYGDTFSLMMIDLDDFKVINDSYGHLAGDRILKGVALKIKASLRGSDFLARFGGDEYAIILIKTDLVAAKEVAWKLCDEVRNSRFVLDDKSLSMTLSIGVAEVLADDTEDTLLDRADAAMYRTKAAGRNGVSVADMRPV